MSPLWLLPVVITVVGIAVMAVLLRSVAASAEALRNDAAAWHDTRVALATVRDDGAVLAARARALAARRRR